MKTKEKLAQALTAAGLEYLAERAVRGEFDDFESESGTPQLDLIFALRKAERHDLAARAMAGEWEGTKEEANAWFEREGRHLLMEVPGGE